MYSAVSHRFRKLAKGRLAIKVIIHYEDYLRSTPPIEGHGGSVAHGEDRTWMQVDTIVINSASQSLQGGTM